VEANDTSGQLKNHRQKHELPWPASIHDNLDLRDAMWGRYYFLVVEQTGFLLHECDTTLLGGVVNGLVIYRSTGSSSVLDTRGGSAENVVNKGELNHRLLVMTSTIEQMTTYESVAGDNNVGQFFLPSFLLFRSELQRNLVEVDGVEIPLRAALLGDLSSDEKIDSVALVGALGSLLPLELEDPRVLSRPPVVGLVTSKTGAVNARLLTGSESDDLTVLGVTDGVGLGVLERNGSDDQVGDRLLGKLSAGGCDYAREGLLVDLGVVPFLSKGDTVDLASLTVSGL